jgi:hypothetical protein
LEKLLKEEGFDKEKEAVKQRTRPAKPTPFQKVEKVITGKKEQKMAQIKVFIYYLIKRSVKSCRLRRKGSTD